MALDTLQSKRLDHSVLKLIACAAFSSVWFRVARLNAEICLSTTFGSPRIMAADTLRGFWQWVAFRYRLIKAFLQLDEHSCVQHRTRRKAGMYRGVS